MDFFSHELSVNPGDACLPAGRPLAKNRCATNEKKLISKIRAWLKRFLAAPLRIYLKLINARKRSNALRRDGFLVSCEYVTIANVENKNKKLKRQKREETRFNLWIIFLHVLSVGVLGLALFPMISFFYWVWKVMGVHVVWLKLLVFSFSIAFGYFIFGTALIFVCVLAKNIFGFRIKPGLFHIHSEDCLRWMGYNSLVLTANSAFLDVLRLSPFQTIFYRAMGAKVGRGVNINTAGLADLSMLEIGDNVLIGGGVALICHASERGFLRLAPTKIGNNVSVGLGSVIMPDCEIGDGASIAPCSFLPKGTKIPAKGIWGGNPVKDLRLERCQS
ncbi:MAG: hypothetical protein A3C47_00095 [Omnitrophica bacterium RIFCSPHIGHO2_02_FULL_51_18]|nr:MAG: hypothetical protein A3C47_00095 [Omnitrophica bacterium RIFCSPHIGHO2_02_FULL_51_18]